MTNIHFIQLSISDQLEEQLTVIQSLCYIIQFKTKHATDASNFLDSFQDSTAEWLKKHTHNTNGKKNYITYITYVM